MGHMKMMWGVAAASLVDVADPTFAMGLGWLLLAGRESFHGRNQKFSSVASRSGTKLLSNSSWIP